MTRAPGQRPQAVVNRGWRREIKRRLWEHKSFVAISSCRIAMCPLYLVRSLARSSSLLIIVRAHGCMSLWRHVCAGGLGWVERWRRGKEKNSTARKNCTWMSKNSPRMQRHRCRRRARTQRSCYNHHSHQEGLRTTITPHQ